MLNYAKREKESKIHGRIQKAGNRDDAGRTPGDRETAERFHIRHGRVQDWERIYLTEGPEGFSVERRGRGSKGRPKQLPKEVEEDLLAEVQRLRAENEYLKNLQALVLERERRQGKKPG